MKATVVVQAAGMPGLPNTGGGGMATHVDLSWLALGFAAAAALGSGFFLRRRRTA